MPSASVNSATRVPLRLSIPFPGAGVHQEGRARRVAPMPAATVRLSKPLRAEISWEAGGRGLLAADGLNKRTATKGRTDSGDAARKRRISPRRPGNVIAMSERTDTDRRRSRRAPTGPTQRDPRVPWIPASRRADRCA